MKHNPDTKDIIRVYSYNMYGSDITVMYGSYAEYMNNNFIEPKDIDIIVVDPLYGIEIGEVHEVKIEGIDIPVSFHAMTMDQVSEEARRIEPKYLCLIFSSSQYQIYHAIHDELDDRGSEDVRRSISSFSSKAYSKGKKKLIIENDYDEYLGLKNIYHAFKFPVKAISFYAHMNTKSIQNWRDCWYLRDIRELIFSTYEQSTGTKEERYKQLDAVIRPLYNKLMTNFRIIFPKE